MSPYLFILCIEYLSRLLSERTAKDFNYHAKCAALRITHLAFADDLMFCKGDVALTILSKTMEEYARCSGLEINRDKSQLFTAGVHGVELQQIKEIFHFVDGQLPIRYLGVALNSMQPKAAHYSPLVDKIASLTKKWTDKNISYAGRAELIRSVLQGVECYWLQVFPLPGTVIDRITRLAHIFLWGTKQAPVAWRDLCLPKLEGSLGF